MISNLDGCLDEGVKHLEHRGGMEDVAGHQGSQEPADTEAFTLFERFPLDEDKP